MVKVQSVTPEVFFKSYSTGETYQIFSALNKDNYISGANLQSYSFQRAVNNLGGSFSISVKERTNNNTNYNKTFLDKLSTLDIVLIKENGQKIDFVGVVTSISYTASEGGKLINVSGRSIEFLLEFFTIALDATAMAWTNTQVAVDAKNNAFKHSMSTDDPVTISDMVKKSYDFFCEVATQMNKLSNVAVKDLIDRYMTGSDGNLLDGTSTLRYQYPISSNLLQNSTVNWIQYIRNLLPEEVYEIIPDLKSNGLTKLKIRLMPFSASDWIKLPITQIQDYSLINYTLSKSIEEVYTNFYSYVEGSSLSPDFWNHLNASQEGNTKSVTDVDKVKLYGYKPLQCNFIGFNTESTNEKDLLSKMTDLNKQLADWYGKLDEVLSGNITIANIDGLANAKIGERVAFIGGQFYVTSENHAWQYGSCAKITYQLDRGGAYTNSGVFSALTGISKSLRELNNAGSN